MSANGLLLSSALALSGAGALVGIVVSDRRNPALLAWFGSFASLLTLWVSGSVLWSGNVFHGNLWTIRPLGALTVSLDRLSALFLFVAAVVVLSSSMFSASYLKRYFGHYSLRTFTAWYLLLFGSIILILIANDVLLFLLAWEAMSVSSYLLVNFEHRRNESSRAGYLMLAMGEAGFSAVVLVFLFLATRAASLDFSALKLVGAGLGPTARWLVFLLTFFGFGVKTGLVPVNTWLPRAHPAAPANVSAILSGVILNLGFYGIIRVNLDLVPINMIGAGVVVLIIGTISALVGILYATTENDLKAMLAHSSIENIGIVTAGLGAGTVDDRVGTRDLNRLGGLIRTMPWTAGTFLVGALAISALPPFNGFVSEWLTLQTMLRSSVLPSTLVKIVFALCGAGLALTAALAVTCFVKAFAMGFLGMSRSEESANAVEARGSTIAPMAFLAVLCLLLGVLPTYVIPALGHELLPWTRAGADALVPPFFASNPAHDTLPPAFVNEFHELGAQVGQGVFPGRGLIVLHRGGAGTPVVFAMSTSYMFIVLSVLLMLTYVVIRLWLTRKQKLARLVCWDGGLRRLLSEMTYTATGFSNPVRVIFDAVFRPTTVEDTRETVAEHFRTAIKRERVVVHVVDRLVVQPAIDAAMGLSRGLAVMHDGRINAYAGYVLCALIALLLLILF
jgi:hydrogenase-4 component B